MGKRKKENFTEWYIYEEVGFNADVMRESLDYLKEQEEKLRKQREIEQLKGKEKKS